MFHYCPGSSWPLWSLKHLVMFGKTIDAEICMTHATVMQFEPNNSRGHVAIDSKQNTTQITKKYS